MKLKVNWILNASGHAHQTIGDLAGVIGLLYAGMESGMIVVRDADDIINSVVAGLETEALYKAVTGLWSEAVPGAVDGLTVGIAMARKQVLKRYVPI